MKTPVAVVSTLVLVILALGCASRGSADKAGTPTDEPPDGAIVDENSSMLTLADYLRRVPGVQVTGSGANTRVEIQGVSSFYLDTEPLYVVDGKTAGTDYAHVASLVPAKQIDYVKVLKGSEATMYGVRGGNGVILIVTKK